ncbi:MAG: putative DNA-binding domain-containing protein, partial [Betaproteobacteria bacterium]|nr:putative DNA-binding domain-containing protein [Betaproteobacteria bacterium]
MQGVSLYEQQTLFAHALRHGDATLDTQALLCGSAPQRAAGMAVYRRNHDASLCAALRAAYPLVCAIVGDAFFATAARHYDDAYPGAFGDLHLRGAHFAAFLHAYAPAASLPYLPDVAALDWAVHRADSAADATALDAAQFAERLQHSPVHLRLRLQPAAAVLRSAFPLYDIWR